MVYVTFARLYIYGWRLRAIRSNSQVGVLHGYESTSPVRHSVLQSDGSSNGVCTYSSRLMFYRQLAGTERIRIEAPGSAPRQFGLVPTERSCHNIFVYLVVTPFSPSLPPISFVSILSSLVSTISPSHVSILSVYQRPQLFRTRAGVMCLLVQ